MDHLSIAFAAARERAIPAGLLMGRASGRFTSSPSSTGAAGA